MLKRSFDIFTSLSLLVALSPLLLITSLLVLWKHGSPVFFTQERPGKDKKNFHIYKFRTMTNKRDGNGELLPDAERLTSFGRFLRSTSIDELPALWNVLKGDMSLVGPRPLLTQYLPYYTDKENKRFLVRPGITGLAQVSGRNYLNWDDRLKKDIFYVENQTFILDMKIIFQTIWKVLLKKDISTDTDIVETFLNEERSSHPDNKEGII